jgi:hypothetical protein
MRRMGMTKTIWVMNWLSRMRSHLQILTLLVMCWPFSRVVFFMNDFWFYLDLYWQRIVVEKESSDDVDSFQHYWDPRDRSEYTHTIQEINEDWLRKNVMNYSELQKCCYYISFFSPTQFLPKMILTSKKVEFSNKCKMTSYSENNYFCNTTFSWKIQFEMYTNELFLNWCELWVVVNCFEITARCKNVVLRVSGEFLPLRLQSVFFHNVSGKISPQGVLSILANYRQDKRIKKKLNVSQWTKVLLIQ